MGMRDTAIVGYAETKIVERSERDVWDIGAEILETLLDKTGFEKDEIDGMLVNAALTGAGNCFWAQATVDFLGLELDFLQSVDIGGCSAAGAVARAAAAINDGLCSTVFLLNADTPVAENNLVLRSYFREWSAPHGIIGPPADFGLLSKRYEHQFGLDYASLGKLAITQRQHALLNDNACEKLRTPISLNDYFNSRMIADPIRLLDCVMPCDGGNGLLITSRRIAKSKGLDKFVVPIGYGERSNLSANNNKADITLTGHAVAGERAFKAAGIKHGDVGSFHPYDDFIIAIMLQLEMLGFCAHGHGSAFIKERDFGHAGDLPLNTSGGQISAGQAGLAGGGTNLIEGVRQLFGEAGARQVKNTNNAVVTGIGHIPYGRNWGTSVVLVLAPDA
jgi:acetyl-CoA acetyltransferase